MLFEAKSCQRGATLVEYALIVALIAISTLASVSFLGRSSSQTFTVLAVNMNDTTVKKDGLGYSGLGGGSTGTWFPNPKNK